MISVEVKMDKRSLKDKVICVMVSDLIMGLILLPVFLLPLTDFRNHLTLDIALKLYFLAMVQSTCIAVITCGRKG